jgi:hypothetical protein
VNGLISGAGKAKFWKKISEKNGEIEKEGTPMRY